MNNFAQSLLAYLLGFVIGMIILLLFKVVFLDHDPSKDTPCSQLGNISAESIPARCIQYYNGRQG